ncbi:MAG: DUF4476 domain-containing protein [Sphingobacteriales bacterium]|nr:MAG: DUF4476 domain-containing protein [Sphingobacteriales bacterium]
MRIKPFLFLLLLFCTGKLMAQQEYFVYLQTDNKQPFYVRHDNKVHSSTDAGYLILPRLYDSSLRIVVGFPKNSFPEQEFTIATSKKDAGFLLKNFGDKGWGLFNWQRLQINMNTNTAVEKKNPELNGIKKTDSFSQLLANAVNDTAVLYTTKKSTPPPAPVVKEETKPILPSGNTVDAGKDTTYVTSHLQIPIINPPVVTENKKTDTTKTAIATPATVKKDSAITATTTAPITKKDTVVIAPPIAKTDTIKNAPVIFMQPDTAVLVSKRLSEAHLITKAAELLTDTSYIAIYLDDKDTIRISIPFKDAPIITKPIAIEPVAKDTVVTVPVKPVAPTLADSVAAPIVIPNSNCRETAWDSDIDKLRVKMLAAKTNDDKITAAKKLFTKKCVTTKQVNALSELFSTDEHKYKWLDACYAFTNDSYNYPLLLPLLKEEYYINRFKAMIRK